MVRPWASMLADNEFQREQRVMSEKVTLEIFTDYV
jgi:hypothetical protein